ncbi:MAG: hypoxanthine phosphoribosyltransferase [Chloroflexi bacterium]|nr:hypoxanthine phosphoribosyltransferase [Chloroflexota bacterium]MBP6805794.1 hypoxanthine phosphoribosyltransferase [Chloroflexota bacterium]
MTQFYPPEAYGELNEGISQVLFTEDEIQARVLAIGQAISRDYEGCHPLMVGVLKGVFPFMSDLLRAITIPVEVDFMAIASYSSQARDKGYVRLQKDLDESIAGRHVLFVEDVVDTGLTLNYLLGNLRARQPASLKVCALFNKSRRRLISVPLQYKGFDLPDKFVVGYGLDYRELYRNLPFVGLLKPTVFAPNGS